jgi:hypothetical protein
MVNAKSLEKTDASEMLARFVEKEASYTDVVRSIQEAWDAHDEKASDYARYLGGFAVLLVLGVSFDSFTEPNGEVYDTINVRDLVMLPEVAEEWEKKAEDVESARMADNGSYSDDYQAKVATFDAILDENYPEVEFTRIFRRGSVENASVKIGHKLNPAAVGDLSPYYIPNKTVASQRHIAGPVMVLPSENLPYDA